MARRSSSRLSGWNGPFYPVLTPELATALDELPQAHSGPSALHDRVRGVAGFRGVTRPDPATDGYQWLCVLEFAVDGGLVLVAIPRSNDAARADGYAFDRSPGVYIKGVGVNVDTANAVMARVVRALRPHPADHRPIL